MKQNKGMQDDFPVERYRAATGASSWGFLHSHQVPQPAGNVLCNGPEAAQLQRLDDAASADSRPDLSAATNMQARGGGAADSTEHLQAAWGSLRIMPGSQRSASAHPRCSACCEKRFPGFTGS